MPSTPEPDTTPSADIDATQANNTDRKDGEPQLSEVALRLNLLGKLIIPPDPH